jgi:hypothetical protein
MENLQVRTNEPVFSGREARIARREPGSQTLADLERTFTVMTSADAAFDFLSDPIRLPEYVPTLRLEDSTAVDGELDVDADLPERSGAPEAGFVADRATRRIAWGRPDGDYAGSIVVTKGTTNTSSVTVHLHTRDEADVEKVAQIFDEAVGNIRRLLSRR